MPRANKAIEPGMLCSQIKNLMRKMIDGLIEVREQTCEFQAVRHRERRHGAQHEHGDTLSGGGPEAHVHRFAS